MYINKAATTDIIPSTRPILDKEYLLDLIPSALNIMATAAKITAGKVNRPIIPNTKPKTEQIRRSLYLRSLFFLTGLPHAAQTSAFSSSGALQYTQFIFLTVSFS